MKRIFFVLAVVAISQAVIAQEKAPVATELNKSGSQTPAGKKYTKMHHDKAGAMKELNLSEDQKTKLKELKAAGKERKDAILNDSKLSEQQKKQELKAIHKSQKDELQNMLTDEQKNKFKEMKEKRKEAKKSQGKSITSAESSSEKLLQQ